MAAHTDEELALLGILATGIGSRQQQTNGVTPGKAAGVQAHTDMLALQRHAHPEPESRQRARGSSVWSLRAWLTARFR